MKEFFILNRKKIIFWSKISLVLIEFLSILLCAIVAYTNNFESGLECLFYGTLFNIGFTIVILPLSILVDYFLVFKRQSDFLNNHPLQNFFRQNKFSKIAINSESIFQLSRFEMEGNIGGFLVRTDTTKLYVNSLFFYYKVDSIPIEKERYKSLTNTFKDSNAILEFGGIFLELKFSENPSGETIKQRLYGFAEILKKENIKPEISRF